MNLDLSCSKAIGAEIFSTKKPQSDCIYIRKCLLGICLSTFVAFL